MDEDIRNLEREIRELRGDISTFRESIAIISNEINHIKRLPEQLRELSDNCLMRPQHCFEVFSKKFLLRDDSEFEDVRHKASHGHWFARVFEGALITAFIIGFITFIYEKSV